MTRLTAKTLGGLRWSYLSAAGRALLSLLVLATLARLLTPTQFGLFAIAWIFVVLTSRFGHMGVGPALIQRENLTDEHLEAGFTLSVTLGVAMTAIVWLLAPIVGWFFDEPMIPRLLRALSVVFIFEGLGTVPAHLLRRNLRFRQLMVADLLAYSLGYGLTAVVLALQGLGDWALAGGAVMRVVIYTGMVTLYSPRPLRFHLTARAAADLLYLGAGFSLVRVFDFIVQQGSYLVIGRWLGASALGYYSRADRLIALPYNHVSVSLLEVLFPAMAQRQLQLDRLKVVYPHGVEILSLVALPVSVMMIVGAPEIVHVILGGQWDATIAVLQVLAWVILFRMCDVLNVAIISAVGAVYRQAWRQAAHAFLVVFGAWVGSHWGLGGVAVVLVGINVAAHALMTHLALTLLGLRWRHRLRCHLPALWASAWAALALWLTAGQLRALALPATLSLLVELLVWLVTIVAALYYAPSFARPSFVHWAVTEMPLETLGAPGRYLRGGLVWLSTRK